MVGVLALVKKAATFGYKRYGVPGALASVAIVLGGYYYLKKALSGESIDMEGLGDEGQSDGGGGPDDEQ